MKNKAILFFVIALFAIAFALNTVVASNSTAFVSIDDVTVNGISVDEQNRVLVGHVGETVPIEIEFTAQTDVDNRVRLKVSIDGFKDEIEDSKIVRTSLKEGVTYYESFNLKLPSTMDLEDLDERITLEVSFDAKGQDDVDAAYEIEMQRDLYSLGILSVDAPETVTAGSIVAVDVVVENNGNKRLNNNYVKVSIPELGVEKKVYVGDLSEKESSDYEEDYLDITDTESKRVYITIPRNSVPGIYNLQVEAYNYDASTSVKKKIVVSSSQVGILPSVTSKTISKGQETTFDVVLINPSDRMVVFSITPDQAKGLVVEATEPVVAVSADSSRTVKIRVKATDSAEEGTHLVTVNVISEDGTSKQVSFSVSVEGQETSTAITGRSDVVLILTVVLAIIFVVLLVILIVLLTRRPAEAEELGETSYY